MKTKFTKAFVALAFAAVFASCSKSNDSEAVANDPGNYILAVTPVASTGVADYLLTASDLEKGTVSILGNGIEQDGTYRYYVTANNKFFSMLYGQGNPGAVTTYNITNGKLTKLSNFASETVQAFAPVNDDILMLKIPRAITNPLANYYRVNTNSMLIAGEGTINTQTILNNGETAFFSWIKQVGTKVYAPFFSIKACCGAAFGTANPDNAWIAVYSYPDMKFEKVITDNRTSFIGRYFTDGLAVVENGDTYAFSSSVATSNGTILNSTKPSSITRLKAGVTEFDQTYLYNVETKSNGYVITNWTYVGGNNFVANVSKKADKGAYVVGNELAIINVVDQSFKLVTGLPIPAEITNITSNNYSPKDGKTAYYGLNLKNGTSYVYKIDASNATATQGVKVEGGALTAIQNIK
ncbi:DUF4374 domain-containing protein [Pedobacter sp. MC2016-15]|uniref:DUF4374 domain-containing protein n=1 Tax=Pedobacter sp. MC2016-15 TaxID=2994473 RepID=UPI002246960F|nr:DUF4374 domain-containing protein [Pedobacter sp. MC2016-15]MCX2480213.1 DUF4374 domain-containing protein [Pedobacter sp. MC2016-15]